jgi:hypothetical protein
MRSNLVKLKEKPQRHNLEAIRTWVLQPGTRRSAQITIDPTMPHEMVFVKDENLGAGKYIYPDEDLNAIDFKAIQRQEILVGYREAKRWLEDHGGIPEE